MGSYRLDRAVLRVSGPDTLAFLQGLLTQDVERLARRAALYAGLLSPQGKLIADMILWQAPEGAVLIDVASARADDLLRRLTMYRLRSNVEIERLDQTIAYDADMPGNGAVPDPRMPSGTLGWRRIVSSNEAAAMPDGAEPWLAKRIAVGIPDLAIDCAPEEVFALEALFEELDGVDFQKGCFVGQENVSRMKRRATTRKKFCPIAFDEAPPASGTPVRAGAAELGTIRSGLPGRAIALLRLDRALEAHAKGEMLTAGDVALRLDPPPWLLLPAKEAPE